MPPHVSVWRMRAELNAKSSPLTHPRLVPMLERLGRAMALYLAGRGLDVALHYATSAEGADSAAAEARALGVRAVSLPADLLDEDATTALIPAAAKALGGPLTVLVNNASIFEYDTIHSATRSSWDRHIGSNLRAPFLLTQQFAAQCPKGARDAAIALGGVGQHGISDPV